MRGALADLFWRILRPSLADAWDAGYDTALTDKSPQNPYRPTSAPVDTPEDNK